MKNIITFDLENWHDSEFIKIKNGADFVLEGLNRVLILLKKHETKATFFVTGDILKKYPNEIKRLFKSGHEIESHGYRHKMLNQMKKEDVKKDIIRSRDLIKSLTGRYPRGFRAPSWSITEKDFWIYEFLDKCGFKYSSSLFPINMGLYGSSKFPITPFEPLKGKKFLEWPIRPYEVFGLRIPFAGGFYFRLLNGTLINYFIKKINSKNLPVIIYLHPWEFCFDLPRTKMSILGKIITYYGLKKNILKLDKVLSNFKFFPLGEIIENERY